MLEPMQKAMAIKRSTVFEELPIEDITRFTEIVQEEDIPDDHVIFREGDEGDRMFIIVSGEVMIQKRVGGGAELKVSLGKGECFGEMAILDGHPRSATVSVIKGGKFLTIGREEFMEILRVYPEISLKLIRILSERLRKTPTDISKTLKEQL